MKKKKLLLEGSQLSEKIGQLKMQSSDEKFYNTDVLVEDESESYGDPNSKNMLIFGDNLLSLKTLEQDFARERIFH